MQFGTRSLLVATMVVAICIPAFLFPGGMYFYLPILLVFLLAVALGILTLNWRNKPSKQPLVSQRPIIAVALLLVLSVATFLMLFDVAYERYSTVRFNETQKQRALDIADYEQFRDVCLKLHSRLTASSAANRFVDGSSQDLPSEIRAINPILITASDHYLSIQVTRDGGTIIAYPLDGTFPHVGTRKLANCLYYWPD